MGERKIKFKGWVLLLMVLLPFSACKTPGSVGIFIGDTAMMSKTPGPPSHAKAYGRRAKHKYSYYPDAEVYYDSVRSSYFYLSGEKWKVSVLLPDSLKVKLGSSVMLELDTAKPYEYHKDNKKKYPPGQMKKKWKKKKKGKKWD